MEEKTIKKSISLDIRIVYFILGAIASGIIIRLMLYFNIILAC